MLFDVLDFIGKIIGDFTANKMEAANMWKPPLAAVVSVEHPLIPSLRRIAFPDHLLPGELLSDAKSVIVFFVPFENRIIESNIAGEAASKEWALAYILTNELLARINEEMQSALGRYGFRAEKIKPTHNFDTTTLMSRWSHRHLAWIAGLGTFGINNMLITSNGCCGRFGSLVTNADSGEFESLKVDSQPVSEKCLFKINGSCGVCRKKCGAGAYADETFGRHKCYGVCLENAERYKSIGLADVCGKCLVGLPCSSRDPSVHVAGRGYKRPRGL